MNVRLKPSSPTREEILANDVKERYGDKIRIPSDFEVLMVNKHLEMNIQTIPKPIKYTFKDSRRDRRSVEKSDKSEKSEEKKSEKSEEKSEKREEKEVGWKWRVGFNGSCR